jgi:hypothetical protein
MIAAIDVGQLAQLVWVSLLAGIGITIVYALVVRGSARSLQARRTGDTGSAVRHGAVAIVLFCIFAAAVVLGVHVMLSKS